MVRTLIVEDQNAQRILQLLESHKNWIEVIGVATSKEEAKRMILEKSPELVFLDIELPSPYDGFDLLHELDEISFHFIVFSGANKNDYPIQALRLASIDFLVKPVMADDLQFALDKFDEFRSWPDHLEYCKKKVELLKKNYHLLNQKKWFLFVPKKGGEIFKGPKPQLSPRKKSFLSTLKTIVYIKSDGHYIHFYVNSPHSKEQRQVIRGKIADVDKALAPYHFIRIHERYLVNRAYIELYIPNGVAPQLKGSGGVIRLSDTILTPGKLGFEPVLPVARSVARRLPELLNDD